MERGQFPHFYVGTVHRHPKEWIIVGLFYLSQVTRLVRSMNEAAN
jgi:hypothetical protein